MTNMIGDLTYDYFICFSMPVLTLITSYVMISWPVHLIVPLFLIVSPHQVQRWRALCVGCFGGCQLYEAHSGRWLRQLPTALPLDRLWHFERQGLLCASSSELLGLTNQLTVWSTEELEVSRS